MSTEAIVNIKIPNSFIWSMLIYLSVSLGCNSSFEDTEKAQEAVTNQAVDITKVPKNELSKYVGKYVRIKGRPEQGKGFNDFSAPFGELIVAGGVFWPDDLIDTTIEIEGKLKFLQPDPESENADTEVVAQTAFPDPEVGGWYMLEDAKIILSSLKSNIPENEDPDEDPFGGF